MIRKLLAIVGIMAFLASNAWAEYIVYENTSIDLKVGVDKVTASTFYDFGNKALMAGVTTSIVQYKLVNLDAGAIGDAEFISPVMGISTDVPGTVIDNIVTSILGKDLNLDDIIKVGLFGGRDINKDLWRYGAYLGASVKF